jgi:putative SOS response-associated peptidase YedK
VEGDSKQPTYAVDVEQFTVLHRDGIKELEGASVRRVDQNFAVITTDANQLVAEIHDRMPLILAPKDYLRWLGEEPDPRDLMKPFPPEPMRTWPISFRSTSPRTMIRQLLI